MGKNCMNGSKITFNHVQMSVLRFYICHINLQNPIFSNVFLLAFITTTEYNTGHYRWHD